MQVVRSKRGGSPVSRRIPEGVSSIRILRCGIVAIDEPYSVREDEFGRRIVLPCRSESEAVIGVKADIPFGSMLAIVSKASFIQVQWARYCSNAAFRGHDLNSSR